MRQETLDRGRYVSDRLAIRSGLRSLRDGRYDDAISDVDPCVHGSERLVALRIKMRALMRTDRAGAEDVIRELMAEGVNDDETARNLESALLTRRRHETRLAREKKVADREAVRDALQLMRAQRYLDALATVEPATEGEFRLPALHIKMRALKRTDLAEAEGTIRALIEHGVETDEVRANLASSLVAKHRKESRAAREKKIADREALREAAAKLRENRFDEALDLVEPCLDGVFRPLALRLKMNALMRVDRAAAEGVIQDLIAIEGETEALASNLAASRQARVRRDSLAARERQAAA